MSSTEVETSLTDGLAGDFTPASTAEVGGGGRVAEGGVAGAEAEAEAGAGAGTAAVGRMFVSSIGGVLGAAGGEFS